MQLRNYAIAVAAGVVALGAGSVSAGAASNNVVDVIKAQDKIVRADPVFKDLSHLKSTSPAQVKKLIPELGEFHTRAEHAATVVSKASTANATEKQGQRDWVKGAREVADGLAQFQIGLEDALKGKRAATNNALARGERLFKAGSKLGSKGDKLLGLPTSD